MCLCVVFDLLRVVRVCVFVYSAVGFVCLYVVVCFWCDLVCDVVCCVWLWCVCDCVFVCAMMCLCVPMCEMWYGVLLFVLCCLFVIVICVRRLLCTVRRCMACFAVFRCVRVCVSV